jgi:hypothetical protein
MLCSENGDTSPSLEKLENWWKIRISNSFKKDEPTYELNPFESTEIENKLPCFVGNQVIFHTIRNGEKNATLNETGKTFLMSTSRCRNIKKCQEKGDMFRGQVLSESGNFWKEFKNL